MATTGFWPVKDRLKEVIDYAENPDKTIDKKYVDSDLYAALRYVSNDKKTDARMYVSGINCNAKRAYERMTATKKRFGKTGGNVAYHGYPIFQTGEATPEEAHKIGMETARRMWGNEYEIVVTTHLNTDNVHNHFVVNSVSFKTGRKFENHISDHYRLREISDAVCLEHGKGILKDAEFYGGNKKKYWRKQNGGLSHRELLKADIDAALAQSANFKAFEIRLKFLGYLLNEPVPHFATINYNFRHRFSKDTIEKVFTWILFEAQKSGYLSPEVVFMDGTHIKANANIHKKMKKAIPSAAKAYEEQLMKEINEDRRAHGKKLLTGIGAAGNPWNEMSQYQRPIRTAACSRKGI